MRSAQKSKSKMPSDKHITRNYRPDTAGQAKKSGIQHIGLGAADSISEVVIYWPSGLEQTIDSQLDFTVYPNPNPGNRIELSLNLPELTAVRLVVFDVSGQMLFEKEFPFQPAGQSKISLQSTDFLPAGYSGVVTIHLFTETAVSAKRLIFLKPN
jgi:hypothetical protein